MTVQLVLNALPGTYAVIRCAQDSPLPDWVHGPGLVSVTRAPGETSILCPDDRVPPDERCEAGWRAVQVENLADLDQPGVVLAAARPVSEAGLGIFVTSTFDRDYVLVRASDAPLAEAAWIAVGHRYRAGGVTLRRAAPDDGEALAALHFRVWQQTYARIAPPEVRLALNKARRTAYWRNRLAQADRTLVAERAGKVVGLCALSDTGLDGYRGALEVDHLYVCESVRRTGLGRRLLELALATAHLAGAHQLVLAVVRENATAIEFYEAEGGRVLAEQTDKGPLWRSDNLIFGWDLPRPRV